MWTIKNAGQQPLRVEDDTVDKPCWHLITARGEHIADIFEAAPGQFELWHEGLMWDGADVDTCARSFMFARSIIAPDQIHRLAIKGDGLEVSPVCEDDAGGCYVCEPEEATMWSVYVHIDGQGVQCVADWDQPEQAERHARELIAAYPCLARHGINNENSASNAR